MLFSILLLLLVLLSLSAYSFRDRWPLVQKTDVAPARILQSEELPSPKNWISEQDIQVFDDKVIIAVSSPSWAKFTDTNSMDPFFDEDAHAIEVMPPSPLSITLGDIISFRRGEHLIVHRVVALGTDEEGMYYLTKGDNNPVEDKEKVRFEQVTGVVVAVIY